MLSLNGLWGRVCPSVLSFLVACVCLAGCSMAESSDAGPPDENDDLGGDGDSMSLQSFAFDPDSVLTLLPSQVAKLRVRIDPAERQTVTFEILADAEKFDGFLLEGSAKVQDNGTATVSIQAPSRPSTFAVRARLGKNEARLVVAVSAQGFGTLVVRPSYSGKRKITRWTATARADMTCEQLGSYWQDGSLSASGSTSAKLDFVPSGVGIAVSLRGDELVSGCTTLTNIKADETLDVNVQVNDRPLGIDGSQLSLSLGIDSTTTSFAQHLDSAVMLALATFKGDATSDRGALFMAIRGEVEATSLAEFDAVASSAGFEQQIGTAWLTETAFSERLSELLTKAAEHIPSSTTFEGELSLAGNDSTLLLATAAGVPAEDAGFVPESVWSVSAESTTTLVLGGVLQYRPVAWLAALAQVSTTSPPISALQDTADCAVLGATWAELAAGEVYQACGAECTELLCDQAVETIWAEVADAGELVELHIGATGEAETTGSAEVSGFTGTWLGRFYDGETSLKGPAEGVASP